MFDQFIIKIYSCAEVYNQIGSVHNYMESLYLRILFNYSPTTMLSVHKCAISNILAVLQEHVNEHNYLKTIIGHDYCATKWKTHIFPSHFCWSKKYKVTTQTFQLTFMTFKNVWMPDISTLVILNLKMCKWWEQKLWPGKCCGLRRRLQWFQY